MDQPFPRFESYEVTRLIGKGGMGMVYFGRDRAGQPVAIKTMSKSLHDPELRQRFLRENRILSTLNHQNIVRCYEVVQALDGTPSIVMEYIEGSDLKAYEGRPLVELLPLMTQTLLGMEYLKRERVIHRDLSSNNIMVCQAGSARIAKILDFGIAKVLADTPSDGEMKTRGWKFLGKPSFASPEALIGLELDWRSDVYSLGVIFYRLLYGRPPVKVDQPENPYSWIKAHEQVPKISFDGHLGAQPTSPLLVDILRRMLAHDASGRPTSYLEIIETLKMLQRPLGDDATRRLPSLDLEGKAVDERKPEEKTPPVETPLVHLRTPSGPASGRGATPLPPSPVPQTGSGNTPRKERRATPRHKRPGERQHVYGYSTGPVAVHANGPQADRLPLPVPRPPEPRPVPPSRPPKARWPILAVVVAVLAFVTLALLVAFIARGAEAAPRARSRPVLGNSPREHRQLPAKRAESGMNLLSMKGRQEQK